MSNIKLKDGYCLYYANIYFEKTVHIGGFTNYNMEFVIAQNKESAKHLVENNYADRNIGLKRVDVEVALKQDISEYVFFDKFFGFEDGCIHPEYQPTSYSIDDMKSLANKAFYVFSSNASSLQASSLMCLAQELRTAWDTLGYWNSILQKAKEHSIQFLDQYIARELDPADENERFYSLIGWFNQTYGQANNYSKSLH